MCCRMSLCGRVYVFAEQGVLRFGREMIVMRLIWMIMGRIRVCLGAHRFVVALVGVAATRPVVYSANSAYQVHDCLHVINNIGNDTEYFSVLAGSWCCFLDAQELLDRRYR